MVFVTVYGLLEPSQSLFMLHYFSSFYSLTLYIAVRNEQMGCQTRAFWIIPTLGLFVWRTSVKLCSRERSGMRCRQCCSSGQLLCQQHFVLLSSTWAAGQAGAELGTAKPQSFSSPTFPQQGQRLAQHTPRASPAPHSLGSAADQAGWGVERTFSASQTSQGCRDTGKWGCLEVPQTLQGWDSKKAPPEPHK